MSTVNCKSLKIWHFFVILNCVTLFYYLSVILTQSQLVSRCDMIWYDIVYIQSLTDLLTTHKLYHYFIIPLLDAYCLNCYIYLKQTILFSIWKICVIQWRNVYKFIRYHDISLSVAWCHFFQLQNFKLEQLQLKRRISSGVKKKRLNKIYENTFCFHSFPMNTLNNSQMNKKTTNLIKATTLQKKQNIGIEIP